VASGLHGGNRLGGNSLSDILVFGRRAGLAAADYVKDVPSSQVSSRDVDDETSRLLAPFKVKNGANPFALKDKIASIMWKYVGIVRNETDLKKGLDEILSIKTEAQNVEAKGARAYNQSWHDSVQVWNMALECEAMIRSALERKESRGAHTRSDYPKKDDEHWLVNIITRERNGQMTFDYKPVEKMPSELHSLLKE
ncbi:MAG TPA: fumarate reductase/succinate dehydrogenase flavoprotein subunit, partial [Candidatus Bathyarchaeia archaeon]|nr:fumarate reductase/succinate dehydrogenase flavoprotein subunit [Candidatus Bathyarchaeia archaeon]